MESHELAYLAGFFDGEGSIGIQKGNRTQFRPNGSPLFGLRVIITNQNLETLLWIQNEFGGKIYKRAGAYSFVIQTTKAEKLLSSIRPYARIKSDQIRLALAFQELRHSRPGRHRLTEEELGLYEMCRRRIRMLNKRDSRAFHEKLGEFSETSKSGNTEPSPSNGIRVEGKVQRLTGEEPTNNPDTSAQAERQDIVRHFEETRRAEDKELLQ